MHILKEMGKPDHITCLLRNLYVGQETTARTKCGTTAAAAAKSLQSCLTPSDPMDCSLPGSSVHGIFQARVLEWGAIAFSDVEPPAASKLGKKYDKAVFCHPAYLTSAQCASCKMLSWMNHNLESRLLGETSATSDMQIIPL